MRSRRGTSLLAILLTVIALAVPVLFQSTGSAAAAPAPGGKGGRPHLTANANAPCNAKPKKKGAVQCFAVVRTPSNHEITPDAAGPPSTALTPADLQAAYNLPSGGSGQTVAIIDAGDDADAEADLAVFRSQYGLPPCTTDNGCFKRANQDGDQSNYPPDSGWGLEISLDVDAVSAACPNCNILLVEADGPYFGPLTTAEDTAVKLGAKYVSNSWGGGDTGDPGGADTHFDHPGVAIVASSGDTGNVVNWPSSISTVTAAGGTYLTKDTSVARGWDEVPWTAGGSGCSSVESKPDHQSANGLNTNCDMRATADIAADADPASGLAVYDGHEGAGWQQVGGTSLSSPLIAAMYALAGTPAPNTYPVTDLYDPTVHDHLFDITTGSNGSCGNVLCNAGPGWDGPTGWGTPNGVAALRGGPHGDITGHATDAATGGPLTGVRVSTPEGYQDTTDKNGDYTLSGLAVGSYTVTAHKFGFVDESASGVQVSDGQTTTQDFALATAADVTMSGTITDGSGQGWPLFAKISIAGDPNGTVFTDPFTGKYSISVPGQASYSMTVAPLYPGYTTKTVTVKVGTSGVQQDAAVPVDTTACRAPGYSTSAGHCSPVSGGLVAGTVNDANTGKPANNVQVADAAGQAGTSGSNTDADIPDGFYWLFASPPGPVTLTASGASYQPATATATVTSGALTRQDWTLKAGQLTITPASVTASETLGQSTTRKVTLTNTGTQPVHVSLGTQAGSVTLVGQPAAATHASGPPLKVEKIKSDLTPRRAGASATSTATATASDSAATGWTDIAPYPIDIWRNAAATDALNGKVYSVGGANNARFDAPTYVNAGYVYDPPTNQWSSIAAAPEALGFPAGAFVGGTFYLVGGTNGDRASSAVYAYTPGSNTWRRVASLPTGVAGPMSAVLGGDLYIVGGCTSGSPIPNCPSHTSAQDRSNVSDAVYRYDPASNTWATLASYPIRVWSGACAGLDGQVVCTGGANNARGVLSATYLYDPVTNSWTQGASIPATDGFGAMGMSYTGANGQLEIAGGFTNGPNLSGQGGVTNEAQAYNPVTNTWSLLPNLPFTERFAAGACGFYTTGSLATGVQHEPGGWVLPGFDQCDGAGAASWLSLNSTTLTVPAGKSETVTLGLNTANLTQPGTYTASLWAATDTPYPVQSIPITLQAKPPADWQKITGTVTGSGSPLAGATVAFSGPGGGAMAPTNRPTAGGPAAPAARTDVHGHYQWWLPAERVQVSAAKDGFQPSATMTTLKANTPATVNFTLKPDPGTSPFGPAKARTAAAGTSKTATGTAATALQNLNATAPVCAAAKPGQATCLSMRRTGLSQHKGLFPTADAPSGYGPSDLQSAYNLPSSAEGGGQTVGIIDAYDDPNAEADLGTYRQQFGLPACTTANGCFRKVNQDGQASPLPPAAGTAGDQSAGWDQEESLDVDMVSAACPNCNIILVEANSSDGTDLYTAEDEAVALGAKYVSNSWAACEYDGETSDDQFFHHPGVVITAAGGDSGYDNYQQGCASPNYPAASPDVISVGGTRLTRDPGTARGWTETTWSPDPSATGSGCSQVEAKPAWQTDTGCPNRMTNDVSADSDPGTGLAVYDTFSLSGWDVFGGTSAATPLIASVYALAGSPEVGTNPASYPYLNATGLNDVTSGTDYNQSCTPTYFCTAGQGYDGPTGLGTPDGVSAFQPKTFGTITGTVTDGATGKPVAGAVVTAGGGTAVTTSNGGYAMAVPPGTYTVTATLFGYLADTTTGVQVAQGQTTTQNFTLLAAANVTVSGTVTDGSGHGWPLYAKITISGVPGAPTRAFYTNPDTGAYTLQLPAQNTYTLTVTPLYPGYATTTETVDVGKADVQHNITVPIVAASCVAPGYQFGGGAATDFTGWTDTTAQHGWTNQDNNSQSDWLFGDPPQLYGGFSAGSNGTGGSGGFAIAAPFASPALGDQDTSLVSPVFSLAGQNSPDLTFNTAYGNVLGVGGGTVDVDLSLDGGTTWQNVWKQTIDTGLGQGDLGVTVPIPQAAGKSNIRTRFHFVGSGAAVWELDNIQVGMPGCKPVQGGLVAGVVSDANTGRPLNGATVTSDADHGVTGTSAAAGDAAIPGGFYWLFSPHTGATSFTATDSPYATAKASVPVAADAVTRHDWALQAGQLTTDATSLSATAALGTSKTVNVTLRNTGGAPVDVGFGAQAGGFVPLSPASAEPPGRLRQAPGYGVSASASGSASAWSSVTDLPTRVDDNAVATDPQTGEVFSVGGEPTASSPGRGSIDSCPVGAQTADGYVYEPSTKTWSPIAPLPQPLESPSAAFVNGTLYVVGGFDCNVNPSSAVYAYTPGAGTWAQVASPPTAIAGAAAAVLNGQLYVVGGCADQACGHGGVTSPSVYRYDPSHNTWAQLADIPVYGGVAYEACAGIDGEIVCAGGVRADTYGGDVLDSAYLYNPASNTWTQGADMPNGAVLQAAYAGAGGRLQVAGGVTTTSTNTPTDRVSQYDPASNTWSALPSLPIPVWGGGGACGMYVVGGEHVDSDSGSRTVQVLPGNDQCDGAGDTGWLPTPKGRTLQPGQSVTLKMALNAAQVNQPGTYTANLYATGNTPYANTVIPVTLQVTPPKDWGLLSGTVTAAGGDPIAGATVQLCANYSPDRGTCGRRSFTVKTDVHGDWQLWLDVRYNLLGTVAAKDGYVQQVRAVRVLPGQATAADFALQRFEPGPHALQDTGPAGAHPRAGEAMPRQRPGRWPG